MRQRVNSPGHRPRVGHVSPLWRGGVRAHMTPCMALEDLWI